MLRGSVKSFVKRLEKMKQATLLRYLNHINLENDSDVYDEMMFHFSHGELSDYFDSDVLDNLSEEEASDVFRLANKYIDLCFYGGEEDYWMDSINDVPSDDYELIALKIFDNYDFLLEVARDNGERSLKQLRSFQKCSEYYENSTIELLRNTFLDDMLLKDTLQMISEENSYYNLFTNAQKAELCKYPKGTLYFENEEVEFNDPLKLAIDLVEYFGEVEIKVDNFSELSSRNLSEMLSKTPIELIVSEVSDIYSRNNNIYQVEENKSDEGIKTR